MNIFIIHCHTANRGDEAAVHALVDELNCIYSDLQITLALRGDTKYPNMPSNVTMINQFMIYGKKSLFAHKISMFTRGRINLSKRENEFIKYVKAADIIIHAPGGPSIGDTYYAAEPTYLFSYDLIQMLKKKYFFYAPSMGPFQDAKRNIWRKRILEKAEAIVIRDPISAEYIQEAFPDLKVDVTLDSAFQHDIDYENNRIKLQEYLELKNFFNEHDKCVGVTITDLQWHPIYSKNPAVRENIIFVFEEFLKQLESQGYGIIFIPQLYGNGNDSILMSKFVRNRNNYFIIPDNDAKYDTYFQQYLISKLYAVVGMRYHSNIFSAKMGTPFISISYEQKMSGFMNKMGLQEYCIALKELTYERIVERFGLLTDHYDTYKTFLVDSHDKMKKEAYRTTTILQEVIEK